MQVYTKTRGTGIQQLPEQERNIEWIGHILPAKQVPHAREDQQGRNRRHQRNNSQDEEIDSGMRHSPCKKDQRDTEYREDSNTGIYPEIILTQALFFQIMRDHENRHRIEKYHEINQRGDDQELEIRLDHTGVLYNPEHTPKYDVGESSHHK